MKSRFLSNMSHEFRTPLNSIRALARLLLRRLDGELTAEQRKQVGLIASAAEDLPSWSTTCSTWPRSRPARSIVHAAPFEVDALFSALRGMLGRCSPASAWSSCSRNRSGLPALLADERKVAQILRNFISNALKFTTAGEVRVAARLRPEDRRCSSCRCAIPASASRPSISS